MHILIVDDHPLTSAGLAALLRTHFPVSQLKEVHNAEAARALLQATDADWQWIFLDLRLPDDPQGQLLDWLGDTGWLPRTVLISAEGSPHVVHRALQAGARGFIPKSDDPDLVVRGFAEVLAGRRTLPHGMQRPPTDIAEATERPTLPPSQQRVLNLVLRGYPNKRIAQELDLSVNTVKEYVSALLAAHGVNNRLDLVLKLGGSALRQSD